MTSILHRLESERDRLRPSETKVADAIAAEPDGLLGWSVSELARRAGVSDPTVLRFCRALGFDGFQDFKLRLAQDLAALRVTGRSLSPIVLGPDDSVGDAADKVFETTIEHLARARQRLDKQAISRAAEIVATANRVEIYGFGASGAVAIDAQHKLFRLALGAVAYSDPHMQAMSAATLGREDVVIAISHTGRSRELVHSVRIARRGGATVIAITRAASPLAAEADVVIPVEVDEDTAVYMPMTSRLVQLVVIDALAVGVALLSPPAVAERLKRMKEALKLHRLGADGDAR